jgi:serpin B
MAKLRAVLTYLISLQIICGAISIRTSFANSRADGSVSALSGAGSSKPADSTERADKAIDTKQFAFYLFSQAIKNSKENVLVSPFSAHAALSMTLNGAGGNTRRQMSQVLGVSTDHLQYFNQHEQAVFETLKKNDQVQLQIANAIYTDLSLPMQKTFMETCKRFYGAEAHSEDFSNPDTVNKINAWCDQKTHGKIPTILKSLTENEKIVLLNAIYFKGTWQKQFDKNLTQDDQFSSLSDGLLPIKMMHQNGTMQYMRGKNFQSVSLPYNGRKQRLIVFLPDKDADWSAFQSQFNESSWNEWQPRYRNVRVNLSLPKFKINYFTLLNRSLIAMGMPDAFNKASANFFNMVPTGKTWISRVLQKTFMDVNEEGTEAAAVTAVVISNQRAIFHEDQVIEFRVDRPFVVVLLDDETGEILFLGSIVKP